MGRLGERVRLYPKVGLDTSIFIYHFEENPAYCALTREILSSIERGERQGITSTISLMEIIVQPLSLGREDIARKYEALLVNFPNLDMIDIDRDIIRKAAQLRAKYRIRTPDAIQISTSLVHQAMAFITNDQRLKRLKEELDVIILDDYIAN